MKKGQKLWTRQELILAINLYCKLPFGKLHKQNDEIINLSTLIGRTPSAVALKLVNFASLDPSLKARGIKGASNSSKLDKEIWDEFYNNWEDLAFESELERARIENRSVLEENFVDINTIPEGKTKEQVVKARINQTFFRKSILAAYNATCCITGLVQAELLIAAHIKPWSIDTKNRLNPRNGIAINALHDKAFDKGLITISQEYRVKVSSILLHQKKVPVIEQYFLAYHNKEIILPSRFLPDPEFLVYHNEHFFQP